MVGGQRRELERSVAAQKMLLQRVQEQEAEAGELQDFLQAEKATLQEALKEAETEVQRLNAELSTKEDATKEMEEQAGLLVRRAEQAKQEALSARAETQGYECQPGPLSCFCFPYGHKNAWDFFWLSAVHA